LTKLKSSNCAFIMLEKRSYSLIFLILLSSALTLIRTTNAFSECPNSNLADPNIAQVTDCLSWFAYGQSIGENVQTWCLDPKISVKCCLTCQNYAAVQ